MSFMSDTKPSHMHKRVEVTDEGKNRAAVEEGVCNQQEGVLTSCNLILTSLTAILQTSESSKAQTEGCMT